MKLKAGSPVVINNIAIPGVVVPPEEHPDEIFPDQIQEAMRYYPSYLRCCMTLGLEDYCKTPQEYLMTITGMIGRTSEIREQILQVWISYYGLDNMALMFGGG